MLIQPVLLIAPLIYLGILWSLVSIFININKHPSFEWSFLSLLALLNILAFLGGFSIGKLVAVVAFLIGVSLVIANRTYKLEFGFSTLISLLLLLLMVGIYVEPLLLFLLFSAALLEGWRSRFWSHSPIIAHALIMLACLYELTLILSDYSFMTLMPVLSMGISVFLLVRFRQYLWQNILIILENLFWLLNITRP